MCLEKVVLKMRRRGVFFSAVLVCMSFTIFQLFFWTLQYSENWWRSRQLVNDFVPETKGHIDIRDSNARSAQGLMNNYKKSYSVIGSIDMSRYSKPPSDDSNIGYLASEPAANSVQTLYQPGFRRLPRKHCSSQHRFAVIVCSAPGHPSERDAIRNTWGHLLSTRHDVHLVFLIGRISVANESAESLQQKQQLQEAIDTESELFGDVVLANFFESYRNLTLKSTAMLEYLAVHCSNVQVAVKVDDDMFINTENLLQLLAQAEKTPNSIYGKVSRHWKPHRDRKNKYFVSEKEFDGAEYPSFVTGPCYIISGDLFAALYRTALRTKYLYLEDIFVTGIVASQVGAKVVNAKAVTNSRRHNDCTVMKDVSLHKVSPRNMLIFHRKLVDGKLKCHPKKKSQSQPVKKGKS